MPRLAIAATLLALVALAGSLSFVGYLVVSTVAEHLDTGHFIAGLLLGVLFARLPWLREGKLRTIGILPKRARLPVMVALLGFCLLNFLYRSEWVPVLFLGFAMSFLLTYPRIRKRVVDRAISSFFNFPTDQNRPRSTDDKVIDVEFREKKE
ncbi:hypothetical protein Q8A64_16810 [Oxalobacteraceae bacterium R-40]|uniref:ATP synthase protein I n=1 Tax=Keguizhuia sedimenti TaxID=3064264 RepID=A0ABU1BSV4_9BURK|nr:hypothetical protein [Oxalobacteraceae bacterium R-40]